MHSSLLMIWGGFSLVSHSCWQVLEVATALPGCLGTGLPGWVAALGLDGCLGLGLHQERHHRWRLAWQHLAPGLGVRADLHPPHNVVGDCFLPSKQLGCVPDTMGDIFNVLKSSGHPRSVDQIIGV